MSIAIPVLIVVAWGALAFGGVYPWVYGPLLGSCVLIGAWGFFKHVPRVRRGINRPLAAALTLLATAIAFQTIPLHRTTIRELSPTTDEFLRQRNVEYALGAVLETRSADELRRAAAAVSNTQAAIDGPRILELAAAASRHPLSIDPPNTALGLAFLAGFGLFFLGLVRALDGRDIRLFVQGLAAVGVVLAFAGIVQAALWNGKVYGFWQPLNEGARPFGPFINANHFAGWMLMAVPLVVGYFLAQTTRGMAGVQPGWRNRAMWFSTPDARRTALTGFGALVMVFALVWTASRSGVACLLVAVVIWGFNVLRY